MFTRIALSVAASALLAGVALQAHAAPGVTTFNDAINDIDPGIATGSGSTSNGYGSNFTRRPPSGVTVIVPRSVHARSGTSRSSIASSPMPRAAR
jgi:hypothetical protein